MSCQQLNAQDIVCMSLSPLLSSFKLLLAMTYALRLSSYNDRDLSDNALKTLPEFNLAKSANLIYLFV
jgi:hypothetical protein